MGSEVRGQRWQWPRSWIQPAPLDQSAWLARSALRDSSYSWTQEWSRFTARELVIREKHHKGVGYLVTRLPLKGYSLSRLREICTDPVTSVLLIMALHLHTDFYEAALVHWLILKVVYKSTWTGLHFHRFPWKPLGVEVNMKYTVIITQLTSGILFICSSVP